MTVVRDQLFPQKPPGSRFRFSRTGVQPSPGSSTIELPSTFAESGAYPHLIENHQALRDSAPCLSRAATLPKATKLELGRGAHLKTPSSANHTAAASQPTGRIAKAASWLHLSRVSPALLPPERPSHTHTPKPGFGGRGHEMIVYYVMLLCQRIVLATEETTATLQVSHRPIKYNPACGHKEVPRSTGHIVVTTRYSDQQGSKS